MLTGHRGLAEAVLFTDLDKLQEGDKFYLHIMDEVLAYQVDQVKRPMTLRSCRGRTTAPW